MTTDESLASAPTTDPAPGCVHCGWPADDPNTCSTFCTEQHDYEDHSGTTDPRPVAPETLDVERLGRAIVEHRTKFWANEPCVANCATDIAAIYLAPEDPAAVEQP